MMQVERKTGAHEGIEAVRKYSTSLLATYRPPPHANRAITNARYFFPRQGIHRGYSPGKPLAQPGHLLSKGGALTDRCDRCSAQAYVKTVIDNHLPLYWCAHHFRVVEEAIIPYAETITDLRHMLTQGAANG